MVGKKDKETDKVSLFTHLNFEFEYNGDQIISAKVTPENLVLLTNSQAGVHIDFTYSVQWKATTKEFKTRFERYLDSDFFENKVLWMEFFRCVLQRCKEGTLTYMIPFRA